MRRSLRSLEKKGFRRVCVLRSVEEIDAAVVVRQKLWNDKRELHGPFDIVGDVHFAGPSSSSCSRPWGTPSRATPTGVRSGRRTHWRIHECVFAVLALESEPVDPRL